MPDTGEPGRRAAGFVTSLAPMTRATSRPVELRVDVVHLLELGIGDVGLGEQDVHVARHPAGDRVDRVLHVDAARLEQLGQLADGVLGLGDGEAVAGHDDDVLGVGQLDRDVVDADLADRAAPAPTGRRRRAVAAAEPADHDVQDRPVHGVGHELGQDRARGADEGAGDDQDRVVDDEAGHRHGRAGERVQQRDDDRHVGAADRQGHRDAEDQRRGEDDQHHRDVRRAGREQEDRRDDRDQRPARSVTSWPPGIMIGLPGIRPWSLPEAISEPVNVIEPMMMSRTMKMFVSSGIGAAGRATAAGSPRSRSGPPRRRRPR